MRPRMLFLLLVIAVITSPALARAEADIDAKTETNYGFTTKLSGLVKAYSAYKETDGHGWQLSLEKYRPRYIFDTVPTFYREDSGEVFKPRLQVTSLSYQYTFKHKALALRPGIGVGYFSGEWGFNCQSRGFKSREYCEHKDLSTIGLVAGADFLFGDPQRAAFGLSWATFYVAGNAQSYTSLVGTVNISRIIRTLRHNQ